MGSDSLVKHIVKRLPQTQAIYFFGSSGTDEERPDSDIDIAVLLPHLESKALDVLAFHELKFELAVMAGKDVDLLNLRAVSTVMQIEVISANRRVYTADEYAADEFEMVTCTLYQRLNEERREIVDEFLKTGRAYDV